MPDITIIRGDSYALRRPLYTYTIVDDDGNPFDLSGCTVRTTYKAELTPVDTDPNDDMALIKHEMTVNALGVQTYNSGLYLAGPANEGIVHDRFTSVETKLLLPNVLYLSDLQVTDANNEIFTWTWVDGLRAVDAVTNRDM